MCGIAGCLNLDPDDRASPDLIRTMTDAIAHRGPDGEGLWIDGAVGLGHRRLAIIDLETGEQPMSNEDGSIQIVFNGAIYNHVELRRDLSGRHDFRSTSDTEVIIHLYEELGDSCVERLNGMFAFALWDGRAKRLLLARDRLGIKPLYWTLDRRRLAFASEIKALLAAGLVRPRPNQRALSDYLVYQCTTDDATFFEGVHRLEPANVLTLRPFEDEPPRIRRYWSFGATIDQDRSFDDFRDELKTLLDDAV